jgi:hypothetical protein
MPLNSRGVAHVLANRAKLAAGRGETVVLVAASGGTVGYVAVSGVVWYDAGAVPAGTSNRVGEVTRAAWDAVAVFPSATVFPGDLKLVARTGTATAAGVAAAETYTVLDRKREGLGTRGDGGGTNYGDRWVVKLRKRR